MFKTKKLIAIGLSCAMTFVTCSSVMAAEADPTSLEVKETMRNIIDKNEVLESYDKLISPTSLSLDNNEIPLYVTFNSQKDSLMKFKSEFSTELDLIKSTFQLDDINEKNYMNYFSHVITLTDSNAINIERGNEMQEFFDIYENKYQNDEIISKVESSKKTRSNNDEIKEEIILLMPSYFDNDEKSRSLRSNVGMPNLTGAINYAKKYATSPNPAYRYFNGADCTNFVSQILNNGGIKQVSSTSKTSGWWYQSSNNYSYSWTVANTFSKYMGRTRYNVTWNTFKSKLVKGSFIGKDNTDDGDLNHMAFITDIKSDKSQVQIAQHTDNYLKWSNSTGWTNIGSKAVYYLVR